MFLIFFLSTAMDFFFIMLQIKKTDYSHKNRIKHSCYFFEKKNLNFQKILQTGGAIWCLVTANCLHT